MHCVSMQVFWAYIVGMLTSLGKMKLDRIHSMLKMFALQGTGGKECSQVRNQYCIIVCTQDLENRQRNREWSL